MKTEILKMAMQLFEASDYESVQMNIVAKKLGISNGTVFYHFPTKQTLFFEIYNIYFCRSINHNMVELAQYDKMSAQDFKAYMMSISENMFEQQFDMIRLLKIHTMILDKGIVRDIVCKSLMNSVRMKERFIEELQKHFSSFNMGKMLDIINARSAILVGCYFLYMEPKSIDEKWTEKETRAHRKAFKTHFMVTFETYLEGVLKGLI